MLKNFNEWNEQKKILENNLSTSFFKEREIWWCSLGVNIGDESCGKGKTFRRPILILKKLSHKTFIGIPLTTKIRVGSWFVDIVVQKEIVNALLHQIRIFSIHRLQRRLTTLDEHDFKQIKEKLKQLLELF